jgi:hypothetical protein
LSFLDADDILPLQLPHGRRRGAAAAAAGCLQQAGRRMDDE